MKKKKEKQAKTFVECVTIHVPAAVAEPASSGGVHTASCTTR